MEEQRFIIYKYKGEYHLIDMFDFWFGDEFDSDIDVQKGGKLYLIRSYEVFDDWYCDIGAVTHTERDRTYLGKTVCCFGMSNVKEAKAKYFELTGENITLDFENYNSIEELFPRDAENEVS